MTPSQFTPPSEPVLIDIGDGVQRPLRYSIKTVRRLKARFGASLNTAEGAMKLVDEDNLASVLYEGLCDKDGNPPEGVTIDLIEDAPSSLMVGWIKTLNAAYFGSAPKKSAE